MSVSATAVAPVFDKTPTAQVSQIRAQDNVQDKDDNTVSAPALQPAPPPEGMGQLIDKMV